MIDEVTPGREPLAEEPLPAREVRGGARRPRRVRRMRRARPTVRSGSLAVVLAAALLTGLALAFQGFARWAGSIPAGPFCWASWPYPSCTPCCAACPTPANCAARPARAWPRPRPTHWPPPAPPRPSRSTSPQARPPTHRNRPRGRHVPARPRGTDARRPFRDGRTAPLPEPEAPEPYAPEPEPEAAVLTAAELDGADLATLDFAALDPDTFEEAVAALCRRDGCADAETVGGAGDLGADVLATAPDGRRVVIQCKRYGPENKVGSQDLQRFGGTCWSVHGAQLAVLVTTSEFTAPAEEYAESSGIRCVDGADLAAWAEGTGPAPGAREPLSADPPPGAYNRPTLQQHPDRTMRGATWLCAQPVRWRQPRRS
ncbi:restriction endonuclease [Actinomadura keratinilytica]